ncbi:MAG: hypothetical protein P4L45_17100 [Ignavibacteriaceae bacterium]|nr:hypothetical protein [Ignavibacteriaceae bacterium]
METQKIKYLRIFNLKKHSPVKIALFAFLAVGIILILSVLIFLSFPQTYLNGFLKDRIKDSFAKAYPEYTLKIADVRFNFLKNSIECDSISLIKSDSSFSCSINVVSLDGLGWIELLREKGFSPNSITKAVLDVDGIVVNLNQSKDQILCRRLHLSVPDSDIVIDSLEYHPLITDEQLFAESKFRNTIYHLAVPGISLNGLVFRELIIGNSYRARSININDAFITVLVNMDKPYDKKSPNPLMVNEALSSIMDTIQIDSLQIMNSRLNYHERYAVGAKAALITFDRMQAVVTGIVNHPDKPDTLTIHARGNFMNTSAMKLFMSIPLGTQQLSFRYGGTLAKMEVSSLNTFLEIAEHHRIKSGTLQSAAYNINVSSGHATGYVNTEYSDLVIAILNKNTGSEKGIADRISSFIAKTFIIKGSNVRDKSGAMRLGNVKYTRKSDDTFIQFVWFALRSGVGNLVGF